MKTFLYVIAGTMMIGFASWAYRINYDTQEAVDRVKDLQRQIAEERAALSLLRAEWAYLNRPERLRQLAELHFRDLELMPIDARHFAEAGDVPLPPEDLREILLAVDVAAED